MSISFDEYLNDTTVPVAVSMKSDVGAPVAVCLESEDGSQNLVASGFRYDCRKAQVVSCEVKELIVETGGKY